MAACLQCTPPAAAVRHAIRRAPRAAVCSVVQPLHAHANHHTQLPAHVLRPIVSATAVAGQQAFHPDDEFSEEEFEQLVDEFGDELYPADNLEHPDDPLNSAALDARVRQTLRSAYARQQEDEYEDLLDPAFYDEGAAEGEEEESVQGAGIETGSEGEGQEYEGKYPQRPVRGFYIADLFGHAAFYEMALELQQKHPEVTVSGLQSDIQRIQEGDMYCCDTHDLDSVPSLVQQALRQGASALILPESVEHQPSMQGVVPESVPVFYVESVDDLAVRLAVAFYEAPSRDMLMIHMVGTQGKTTTSWLIRGILEEMQQVTGMSGSIEVAIAEDRLDPDGDLWEPVEQDPTETRECSAPFMIAPYRGKYALPDAGLSGLQTQKVLAGMRERGATCCVYEPSPVVLARRQNVWTDVNVVVHTVLAPEVVGSGVQSPTDREFHQSLLRSMLDPLDKLVDAEAQALVVNVDDPRAPELQSAAAAVPQVTYACDNPDADVYAESIKGDIWETEVIVRTPQGRLQIITPLLGKHNVYNILAAVATGLALKVPLKSIVAGIEAVEIIPGRCEVVDEGQDFSVIVDSANTPQALESMLKSLRNEAKRVVTVLGCRGEEDRAVRPLMAEVAHSYSDMVILTNDSPRREPPQNIIQDMVAGLPDSIIKRYSGYVYFPFQDQGHVPLWFEPYLQKAQRSTKRYVMEDRFSAIRAAIGSAVAGDVVVLAGRGHSDCMEYDNGQGGIVKGWFDDRLEARAALTKLTYLNQLTKLTRKNLPWGSALEEMDGLIDPPAPLDERAASLA